MSALPKFTGRILPDKSEVSRRGLEQLRTAALILSAGDPKGHRARAWIRLKDALRHASRLQTSHEDRVGWGNHPLLGTEDAEAPTCRSQGTAKNLGLQESQLARRFISLVVAIKPGRTFCQKATRPGEKHSANGRREGFFERLPLSGHKSIGTPLHQ